MLKKKQDKLAETAAALRKRHAESKSQPQWDQLEAWCLQTTANCRPILQIEHALAAASRIRMLARSWKQ
jgi:hypothetical protein